MAERHPTHHAAGAQVADQRASIETGNNGDAGLGEEGAGFDIGAPVTRDGGKLADHQALDVGTGGFVVVTTGSVVADLRLVRMTIWPE